MSDILDVFAEAFMRQSGFDVRYDAQAVEIARECGALGRLMGAPVQASDGRGVAMMLMPFRGKWAVCIRFVGFAEEKDNGFIAFLHKDKKAVQWVGTQVGGPILYRDGWLQGGRN
jgi:hypothetical protein